MKIRHSSFKFGDPSKKSGCKIVNVLPSFPSLFVCILLEHLVENAFLFSKQQYVSMHELSGCAKNIQG